MSRKRCSRSGCASTSCTPPKVCCCRVTSSRSCCRTARASSSVLILTDLNLTTKARRSRRNTKKGKYEEGDRFSTVVSLTCALHLGNPRSYPLFQFTFLSFFVFLRVLRAFVVRPRGVGKEGCSTKKIRRHRAALCIRC